MHQTGCNGRSEGNQKAGEVKPAKGKGGEQSVSY
jgi:hypothetical protein